MWAVLWSCWSPASQRAPSVSACKQLRAVFLTWKVFPLVRCFTISARQWGEMGGEGTGTMAIPVLLQGDYTLLLGLIVNHVKTTLVKQFLRTYCAYRCSCAYFPTETLQEGSIPGKFSIAYETNVGQKGGEWRCGIKWNSDPKAINHIGIFIVKVSVFLPGFLIVRVRGLRKE